MTNTTTFLALLFVTSILMLVSFATANINLLLFAEFLFFAAGLILLINNKLKKQNNVQKF